MIVEYARYLQCPPSRSAQYCEKDAFSDCSSSTTNNLFPALLSACTRPRVARRRESRRFRILATDLERVLGINLRALRRGVLTPRARRSAASWPLSGAERETTPGAGSRGPSKQKVDHEFSDWGSCYGKVKISLSSRESTIKAGAAPSCSERIL